MLRILAEHSAGEGLERSLEVAHGDVLVNDKSLELMEHRRMGRIDRVGTINSSGGNYADRRLSRALHCMHLNRRGLRTEQDVVGNIEGVLRIARRVVFR